MRELVILALFLSVSVFAQEDIDKKKYNDIVPFSIIEDVPVYPGCVGNKKKKKQCFNKSMQRHIAKHFNIKLAENLPLSPGRKKIFILFKINEKGKAIEVKVRAPHPRLEEEGVRVINLLPTIKPGKQKGVPVRVGYIMPVTFTVERKK